MGALFRLADSRRLLLLMGERTPLRYQLRSTMVSNSPRTLASPIIQGLAPGTGVDWGQGRISPIRSMLQASRAPPIPKTTPLHSSEGPLPFLAPGSNLALRFSYSRSFAKAVLLPVCVIRPFTSLFVEHRCSSIFRRPRVGPLQRAIPLW